jgi:hypothetical protein
MAEGIFLGTADITTLADPYYGRLLEPPVITTRRITVLYGAIEVQDLQVRIGNADHGFTPAVMVSMRGRKMVIKTYDDVLGQETIRWTGIIDEERLHPDGSLELFGTSGNIGILNERIPKVLITPTNFPLAIDVNKAPNVVFGVVSKVRLHYVREDNTAAQYDYLIGHGATVDVLQVYRSITGQDTNVQEFIVIPASEYTVSTTLYPGYTALRFGQRQADVATGLSGLYADLSDTSLSRNVVNTIQAILSNPTWGLGELVNAGSAATAATILHHSIGSRYFCDGVIGDEAQPASDILGQLFMFRGIVMRTNAAGEWEFTVDAPTVIGVTLGPYAIGTGPDSPYQNVLQPGTLVHSSAADRVKTYILQYAYNQPTDSYLRTQVTTLGTLGRDVTEFNDFLQDSATAVFLGRYIGHRLFYDQGGIDDVELGPEGRACVDGALVSYTYLPYKCYGDIFQVRSCDQHMTGVRLTLRRWHPAIHEAPALVVIGGFIEPEAPPPPEPPPEEPPVIPPPPPPEGAPPGSVIRSASPRPRAVSGVFSDGVSWVELLNYTPPSPPWFDVAGNGLFASASVFFTNTWPGTAIYGITLRIRNVTTGFSTSAFTDTTTLSEQELTFGWGMSVNQHSESGLAAVAQNLILELQSNGVGGATVDRWMDVAEIQG